jgi:uncharacterized cupin superfamily protein
MPKLDLDAIPQTNATGYPPPFDEPMAGRWYRRLAPAIGLTEMGASHIVLKPGGWSSQRHWHDKEDELVVVISGEAVLIEDEGETVLVAGDVAAWPKGLRNGHHLVNRTGEDCVMIAISAGDTAQDFGEYSDIDLKFDDRHAGHGYLHKDGTPYPPKD